MTTRLHTAENRPSRIALYSHDALGMGHIRRNLAIANSLSSLDPSPDILLLTSAPEAVLANRPPGCDMVCLPAMAKDDFGQYRSRYLSLAKSEIWSIRRDILTSAVSSFKPDVLIVDKHPRGFRRELEPALAALRESGGQAVLGLRDIMDRPEITAAEWRIIAGKEAVDEWFSQVWVYGDPRVHDVLDELDFSPSARRHAVHTGYLANGRLSLSDPQPQSRPFVLATFGGGQDGAATAMAFAEAEYPSGHTGLLITGSHMPDESQERLAQIAAARNDLTVQTFVPGVEDLMRQASAIVAMGGYNTVCEAIAHRTPLLVIPRTAPRQEQLIRARGLARMGCLDYLLPTADLPEKISAWLHRSMNRPRPDSRIPIDLDGLTRLPKMIDDLIQKRPRSQQCAPTTLASAMS